MKTRVLSVHYLKDFYLLPDLQCFSSIRYTNTHYTENYVVNTMGTRWQHSHFKNNKLVKWMFVCYATVCINVLWMRYRDLIILAASQNKGDLSQINLIMFWGNVANPVYRIFIVFVSKSWGGLIHTHLPALYTVTCC